MRVTRRIFEEYQVHQLSFSRKGPYLETNQGLIGIPSNSSTFVPQSQPLRVIFLREDWIVESDKNLIWLPHSQRPYCSAFEDDIFALEYVSGEATFISFSPTHPFIFNDDYC
jgi:hypothetical protein